MAQCCFFLNIYLFILLQTIVIIIYFKNIVEFSVSDKQNNCNQLPWSTLFLHALVVIAVRDLFMK